MELLKGNYLLAGSKCQGRIVQSQKKRDGRYIEVNGQIGCTQLHNDKSGEVLAVWEALNSMHPISIKIREKNLDNVQLPQLILRHFPNHNEINLAHKYIFYHVPGDRQKTRESNLSFWKKVKGFSSEMVLNKLAMASLCAVRSVVGEGGDGEFGAEG